MHVTMQPMPDYTTAKSSSGGASECLESPRKRRTNRIATKTSELEDEGAAAVPQSDVKMEEAPAVEGSCVEPEALTEIAVAADPDEASNVVPGAESSSNVETERVPSAPRNIALVKPNGEAAFEDRELTDVASIPTTGFEPLFKSNGTGPKSYTELAANKSEIIALLTNDLEALAVQFDGFHRNIATNVVAAGEILIQVKDKSIHGLFLPFLVRVGIEPRTAQQYMAIARSPLKDQIAEYGTAKAVLLARQEKIDHSKVIEVLADPETKAMTVKELASKLKPPKGGSGKEQDEETSISNGPDPVTNDPMYRRGFDDGLRAEALQAWAVGVLEMEIAALTSTKLAELAEEAFDRLVKVAERKRGRILKQARDCLADGASIGEVANA